MTHKTFLFWLLYIVVVIFGFGVLCFLGLPQIALQYDHSHLTYLLFGCYLLAEVLSAREVWYISDQERIANAAEAWFRENHLTRIQPQADGGTWLHAKIPQSDEYVPPSAMAEYFNVLARSGSMVNQDTLLDVTADRLYDRAGIAEFISQRIVWIGILATILGVIMAFWPMIHGGSIDQMKANISEFFGGVAVAFIPTAVSFVLKIVLDVHTFIISNGVRKLLDTIACLSEAYVIPVCKRTV